MVRRRSSTSGWGTANASPTPISRSTDARSRATTACSASSGSPRAFDGEGLIDLEPRLAELEIPAFVLWGEDDAFLPAELAERLGDALPWASVALLPGCGHFLLEDAPETVAPLIVQWLRTQYLRLPQAHAHDGGRGHRGARPASAGGRPVVTSRLFLTGITASGRHGANPGEKDQAQDFVVDLDVEVEVGDDELASTADYRTLIRTARETVERDSFDLLESLARRRRERRRSRSTAS